MVTVGKAALAGLWTVAAGRERPGLRRRPWLTGLFFLLAVAVGAGVHDQLDGQPQAVRFGLAVAVGLTVVLVPRHSLMAWRIAMVATLLNLPGSIAPGGISWPWHPMQLWVLPLLVLVVALRHETGTTVVAALLTVATMAGHLTSEQLPVSVAAVVVLALIGDQVRRRVEVQHSLAAARELTAAEQERSAVLEERARIAREMHDVVAHHMSMIAVRAETAPYRVGAEKEARDSEFTAIAGASRAALQDMRRLLGVLRSDDVDAALTPSPGLGDISDMVGVAAESGLDVALVELTGNGVHVAPLVGQTAYRIVQEGLSNATRHAPGAPVRVEVAADEQALHVVVGNAGSARGDDTKGGGHGIAGMRERVAAVGGELTAGPTTGGGFEIRARLPLSG
ncbi:sensor histidine kinase [Paractinoplanes lichenicola]|uniref:histidine kinase n=1 Tax=Paractinoplanes lichenicola TaxID=2802976 RepID=A0ABS1VLV5_9ACTN|nr:histidine kinase [Actinoplanes lichenicola]MBL7255583.1 two-component sensor histidine kinase [Actinoplanes lichenicola]